MSIQLSTRASRTSLNHATQNEIFALVSFGVSALDEAHRPPLDIAVAMDVSGSMDGAKIANAKAGLRKLIAHLTPRDRLAIVTFTDHVATVLPFSEMTVSTKRQATTAVEGLRAQCSTNLSGGLLQALDHLQRGGTREGAVRRCLIFTDGLANVGITKPDQLASTVLEARRGIGISAFGYGRDHDPVLLRNISQDGEFYYIETPDQILSAFGAELGGLVSTAAQNVRLTLEPRPGVRIAEVLNDLTVREEAGKVHIEVDDLLAEQDYHVVLRLELDRRDKCGPRPITLFTASGAWFDIAARERQEAKASVKVAFVRTGREDKADDAKVMEEVALQRSVQAQAEAIQHAEKGDLAAARSVLNVAAAFAVSIGTPLAQATAAVSRGLAKENYASRRVYDMGGRNEAYAVQKGLSRRRVSTRSSKGGVDMGELFANRSQSKMQKEFEASAPAAKPVVPAKPKKKAGPSKSRGKRW